MHQPPIWPRLDTFGSHWSRIGTLWDTLVSPCSTLGSPGGHFQLLWCHFAALWWHFRALRGSLLDTLGSLLHDLGYMRVTLESLWSTFEKQIFFGLIFNDFMHLWGQLDIALRAIFINIMEDSGRKVKNGRQT